MENSRNKCIVYLKVCISLNRMVQTVQFWPAKAVRYPFVQSIDITHATHPAVS